MRVTDKMTADSAIYNINSGKIKLNHLNEQLTSNLNINRPSDDPISTRQIMDMEAQVNSNDQYVSNIKNAQTWVKVANTSLQGMNDSISQAKSAAANIFAGMNDSVSVSNTLATLQNVRQQLIDMTNVQVGDQYVFGGFDASTPVVASKTMTGTVDPTKPPNQISGLNTAGPPLLVAGMSVTGPGIPANTTITAVNAGNVIISNNPTEVVSSGSFAFGAAPLPARLDTGGTLPTITGLNTAGPPALAVGMQISGPGIPPNTTITNIVNATDINISNNPTAPTSPGNFTFQTPPVLQPGTIVGQPTIYGLNVTGPPALTPGMSVTINPPPPGTPWNGGIPAGTTIVSVNAATNSVTLSNAPWVSGQRAFNFGGGISIQTANSATAAIQVASTAGLSVGMPVSGPGLDPNHATTITNIDPVAKTVTISDFPVIGTSGTYTFTNAATSQAGNSRQSQIQGLVGPGTADLAVGMTVTGAGVPANTTITSIVNGTDVTLSNALTATVAATLNFDPTINRSGTINLTQPNQITGLATTVGLAAGMSVSGAGIPVGTTITAVNAITGTVTLSNSVTQMGTANFAFGKTVSTQTGNTNHPPNMITGLPTTTNLYVGMKISGPGIPQNTTITAINNATDITISNVPTLTGANNFVFEGYINANSSRNVMGMTTSGSTTVTLPSTAKLAIGMAVSGPGIPPPPAGMTTTIAAIAANGTDITLSAPATSTSVAPGAQLTITAGSSLVATGNTASALPTMTVTLASTAGLKTGMVVSGVGIPAGPPATTIASIVNGTDITLSAPATNAGFPAALQLNFFTPGAFAPDDVNVNITRSSQVALNYSGAKLLLGGAPAAPSQASGPPPSNLPINILGTIGELINAIQNKNSAGVQAASSNLKAAADQINLAQSEYASRAIRLDSANTMLTNNQNTMKGIISNKQNLDAAKAIIELQQQTTAYQAALQATAKITPLSLMDYLK